MARFSNRDWMETGLALLGEKGPEAMRIDRLCAAAKRTRGSFYHHFESRDEFVSELMYYWRETRTRAIIDKTNIGASNARKRLYDLAHHVLGIEDEIENALRRWAASESQVARVLMEADQERIAYTAALVEQSRNLDPKKAHIHALLLYAVFVGVQTIGGEIVKDRRATLDKLLGEMSQTLFDG